MDIMSVQKNFWFVKKQEIRDKLEHFFCFETFKVMNFKEEMKREKSWSLIPKVDSWPQRSILYLHHYWFNFETIKSKKIVTTDKRQLIKFSTAAKNIPI